MIVTGEVQHRVWFERGFPPAERVSDHLVSVPVPIPANPLRYTLCSILRGDDGLYVLDPGWDSDEGWTALLAGLELAGGTAREVRGVLISHVHRDHHGNSARLVAASGAWIAMTAGEAGSLPRPATADDYRRTERDWLHGLGVPHEEAELLALPDEAVRTISRMPLSDITIADGAILPIAGRQVRALITPGHTVAHLCLHDLDEARLFSGDTVLPRITPNVAIAPGSSPHPLTDYRASLIRLAGLGDVDVAPGHEWRFTGLADRVSAILHHHDERRDEVAVLIGGSEGWTAWELAQQVRWSRPWPALGAFQRRVATAEIRAHLDELVTRQEAVPHRDDSGVTRYT